MRTFLIISAAAAVITVALSSCSAETKPANEDKELVYKGAMAEPQLGEQPAAAVPADTASVHQ